MSFAGQSPTKRPFLATAAFAAVALMWSSSVRANTLLESWENTDDGWNSSIQTAFTRVGFSTTTGVTDGTYSWAIGPAAGNTSTGPNYGAMLSSPSTTALTTALANIGTQDVNVDVFAPAGSFGGFLQIQLDINNTDSGYTSVSNYLSTTIGVETTLSFSIPTALQTTLASSANPTSLVFQIGGGYGGAETFYLDNLNIGPPPVPPATFATATASWVLNGSGNWATAANWSSSPNIPGAVGSRVTFGSLSGSPAAANPVVTLKQAASIVLLDFQSPDGVAGHGYTISGAGGSISVTGELEADSGSHTVNVPLALTSASNPISIDPGASITVPVVSNSGVFDTFFLTATDGSSKGGTFSEGGMQFCSIDVNGTWNILSSMSTTTSSTNAVEFFSTNVEANSIFNVGSFNINTNSIGGSGNINIGTGGTLTSGYFNSESFFSGTFTGSGSLIFTGLIFNAGGGPTPNYIYGSSPSFSGPVTINGGETVGLQTANGLGTGILTLDNGVLQSIGSFVSSQNVVVTANGGTIDTDGPAGGTGAVIPGGTAITLGTISSTAAGAVLTKINPGQVTVTNIRGTGLIVNGGTVQIAPSASKAAGLSVLPSLSILTDGSGNPQATLDLTNNDLIVQNGNLANIAGALKAGFNNHNGYWNGLGITSSKAASDTRFLTTLGYRQSDGTPFDGTSTTTADVLVKYTYYGDANLDGVVNGADYQQIDLGFGSGGTDWSHGDFNYDGVVNGSDFALIDNTFNQITATGAGSLAIAADAANIFASPAAVSAVPEPATLGLLSLGALSLIGRRRRARSL